jgi:hypothetical protein
VSGAEDPRFRVFSPEGEDTMARSRTSLTDPDHHLWRNGRLWWVAFTVHLPGWQKDRVRLSLGTADVAEARRRRDELLRAYPQTAGCELSLRVGGRRVRALPMAGGLDRGSNAGCAA